MVYQVHNNGEAKMASFATLPDAITRALIYHYATNGTYTVHEVLEDTVGEVIFITSDLLANHFVDDWLIHYRHSLPISEFSAELSTGPEKMIDTTVGEVVARLKNLIPITTNTAIRKAGIPSLIKNWRIRW